MKNLRLITVFIFSLMAPSMGSLFSGENSICAYVLYNTKKQDEFVSMAPADTEKHTHPLIKPAPAPGTAVILADSSARNHDYLTVRVSKVLAYGSSTPVLPTGSSIDLIIPGSILDGMSLVDICTKINTGSADTLVIHYSAETGLGLNDKHWTLTRIH